jgi:membrane protein implicated in regulation of membrane protease activity
MNSTSSINIGDVILQLIMFGFLALFIILIVSYFRSKMKRSTQLDRIEEKLNILTEEIKKYNNK